MESTHLTLAPVDSIERRTRIAGTSGLPAASDLVARGLSVIVVEARDRVGGRILNHPLSNGVVVELGGQWVGPTQDRVPALAARLGVELFPTYEAGAGLVSVDGKIVPFEDDTLGLADEPLNEPPRRWRRSTTLPGLFRWSIPGPPPRPTAGVPDPRYVDPGQRYVPARRRRCCAGSPPVVFAAEA